jgi:hypothetical protein
MKFNNFSKTCALLALTIAGTSALAASPLNGTYAATGRQCDFDGSKVQLVAKDSEITLQLVDSIYGPRYELGAKIGDFMTSFNGAVNRTISFYGAKNASFSQKIYVYDVSLSPSEGIVTGFFQQLDLAQDATGNVSFTKFYADGSGPSCTLTPVN